MTRFRYDVLLHVGREVEPEEEVLWVDWEREGLSLETVRHMLEEEPDIMGITGIPNARVQAEVEMVEWLNSQDGPETMDGLREVLGNRLSAGVDPEDLWALSQEMLYTVNISWSRSGRVGNYDVMFKRRLKGQEERLKKVISSTRGEPEQRRAWSEYANAPLQRQAMPRLIPQLRSLLKERLPDYMIPASFVLLETLPLTANGKVDRRALPAPDYTRPELQEGFVAPRTSLEEVVAGSWSQVLGIEQIGIHDDFFALGGHSLLAMQVISHLRPVLQVEVPLHSFFEAPTVAQLSEILKQHKADRAKSRKPALRSISREAYRMPSL